MLCFQRTLIKTSSASYEPFQPNNKFQVSVCVVSSFFLRLCKRYYEETGSNFNIKPTEKSSLFVSYKQGGNSFDHLTFIRLGNCRNCIDIQRHHPREYSEGNFYQPKSMMSLIYVFVLTPLLPPLTGIFTVIYLISW